jgi:hypothetical protein
MIEPTKAGYASMLNAQPIYLSENKNEKTRARCGQIQDKLLTNLVKKFWEQSNRRLPYGFIQHIYQLSNSS